MTQSSTFCLGLTTLLFGLFGCEDAVINFDGGVTSTKGGSTGEGGASEAGGATDSGGAIGGAGVGGAMVEGGASSVGGAPVVRTATSCLEFESGSPVGWSVSYAKVHALDNAELRDEVASDALQANTVVEMDSTPGYGGIPGSVKLTVPFATLQSNDQSVAYSQNPATPWDLGDQILKAYVRLDSGMTGKNLDAPSGAKLYIKTGGEYVYVSGGWFNLAPNDWAELTLDTTNPEFYAEETKAKYDRSDVREIGVEVYTSGATTEVETPGVVRIDHVCFDDTLPS